MKCFGTTCWTVWILSTLNGCIFWKKTICRKVWWELSWRQLCWHQFPVTKTHLMWSQQRCWNIQSFRWMVKLTPLCNTWVSTCPLALHTEVLCCLCVFFCGWPHSTTEFVTKSLINCCNMNLLEKTRMRDLQVYSTGNWSRWLLWRGSRPGCLLFGKSQSAKRHLSFAKNENVTVFAVFVFNVVCFGYERLPHTLVEIWQYDWWCDVPILC